MKTKSAEIKIGKSTSVSLTRNCILCMRYRVCRDPSKKPAYACSRFKEADDMSADDLKLLFDNTLSKSNTNVENAIAMATDEESIADMIENVLSSGIPVPPDLRINDRHILRPKNIYEWMVDPRFIGSEQKPFPRQIQVGLTYMAEYCPRCTDMDFFECLAVDTPIEDIEENVQMLEYGKCPRCRVTKAELVENGEINDYLELGGLAGQRAAKTTTLNLIESYGTARWLLTPNLPDTYQVLPSTVLTSTYTAVTFNQAKNNFWSPLSVIFTTSQWYKEYHRFLFEEGKRYGEELFTLNETLIRYRHKNIFLSPAAPSKRTLRGATRISAAIDELSWFPVGKTKGGKDFERLDAKEVYTALKRSLATMRSAYRRRMRQGYSNLPKPIFSNISSPSSKNDALMALHRQAQGSKEIYTFKYPTWEFNPLLTKEDFAEEFRLTPVEAERDYGCNPPLGMNTWISDLKNVIGCFSKTRKNGLQTISIRSNTKNKKLVMSSAIKRVRRPSSPHQGVLILDAGYSNNCFAYAICYPKNIPQRGAEDATDSDEMDYNVEVEVFAVGEVIPREGVPISFNKMYKNVLLPICLEYNIGYVVSDRWQNIKMMQDLEDASNIEHFEHRLTATDFASAREAFYEGMINLPRLEDSAEKILDTVLEDYPFCFNKKPVSHLYFQLGTVQDTGSSVVKGSETTDDILRCVILGYTVLQDPDVLEGLEDVEEVVERMAVGHALAAGSRRAVSEVRDFGVAVTSTTRGSAANVGGGSMGVTSAKKAR